jgi:hypothetical protein
MTIQQLPTHSHQLHVKTWFKAYMSIIMIYGMLEQIIWPKNIKVCQSSIIVLVINRKVSETKHYLTM